MKDFCIHGVYIENNLYSLADIYKGNYWLDLNKDMKRISRWQRKA